jgi:heptosyltransferase-2
MTAAAGGRLLVRAPNWVGDVVLSLPALRDLRRAFPGARLSVLARPWVADL